MKTGPREIGGNEETINLFLKTSRKSQLHSKRSGVNRDIGLSQRTKQFFLKQPRLKHMFVEL